MATCQPTTLVKMRILHIHDIANVGSTLVEGLRQIGHEAELRRLNLAVPHGSTLAKLLVSPLRLREMWRVNQDVRRGRYDIVHIHFAYLGWLGILGRYPYFLHCHGSDIRRDMKDWRRRWFIEKSLQRAQKVFFATPDLANLIYPLRPDAIFLPNPVNTEQFHPSPIQTQSSTKILLGSAFYAVKGVELAMTGLQAIIQQHPEVAITAFATGPEYPRYQDCPGIQFISPVSHTEMPALYQAHDFVIGQFEIGSLGMVELESMACGKPVICYYAGNQGHTSSPPILNAQSAPQITEKISYLLKNRAEIDAWGQKGRTWVLETHDYRLIVNRLVVLYQQTS